MGDAFIDRVKKTVLSNIQNEKFGVLDLAKELGFSRSQLLRKIKKTTGSSVNQFIREIRLKEAAKLLLNADFTASEVAYRVGFSSPSYFTKCFLEFYGVTPGEFKKSEVSVEDFVTYSKAGDFRKAHIAIALSVVLILVGFLSVFVLASNSETKSSIAVLPLLDLSENQDKEYLVDGLTEAITLELSKNESLRVISRGSAMKYKGENKLYSNIAKDLNVDLLLEGSVLYSSDSLRIVVQLIEPMPKEKHIWQNSYDHNYSDILGLVNDISNEIAKEISLAIEPQKNELNYKPNFEAYDLYLKGRHILNTQKTREFSLQKALDYLMESIEKDPNFAPAQVSLAETYLAFNSLIGDNEVKLLNRKKAKNAVNKALEIDDTYAEAYITKGNLSGKLDWNWEEMRDLARKGLLLDPNNAKARILLSDYYLVKGNYIKAIEEALLAEKLDPINPYIGCFVAERYYINHEFENSINKYKQVIELNPNYGLAYNSLGHAYLKMGQVDEARDSWIKLQHIMGNNALADCFNSRSFRECLYFFLEKAKSDTPRFCRNPSLISSVHMLVDENLEALKYLEIAYQNKSEDLPIILTYPDFHPLHNQEEFQKIAEKVGVHLNDYNLN